MVGRPGSARRFSRNSSSDKEKPTSPKSSQSRRDSILIAAESKADPTKALKEEEPAAKVLHESTTLPPLRAMVLKDREGNPITDPDLSNPSRPRLERPLDTIRGFEAAINGIDTFSPDHDFRKSTTNSMYDIQAQFTNNRRTSSNFGTFPTGAGSRPRLSFARSDYGQGYGGYESGYNTPGNGWQTPSGYQTPGRTTPNGFRYSQQGPRRSVLPRSFSEQFNQANYRNSYQAQANAYASSHDTVNTFAGSDGSGAANYSTDPSSENSSLDRMNAATKSSTPDGMNDYAYDGYNNHTISEEHNDDPSMANQGMRGPPNRSYNSSRMNPVMRSPLEQPDVPRKPIQLGNSVGALQSQGGQLPPQPTARPEPEKRMSWLKRRLSKRA